jgi:tetratricopeptide (TPR) repeat protein
LFVEAKPVAGKTRKLQIEEMLAEEPNDAELRYALAMEYVSAGENEGALRCFRGLVDIVPNYVPAYYQMAQTLVRMGRGEEARPVVEKGIGVARSQGNQHAADELQALLDSLE